MTPKAGHLTVTDDDVIEKSNLTRQFLFRNHNVGKSKSLSAIEAARRINPALKSTPLQDRVAPSTEAVFNTDFWSRLDLTLVLTLTLTLVLSLSLNLTLPLALALTLALTLSLGARAAC